MNSEIRNAFSELKATRQRFVISPQEKWEKDIALISYLSSLIKNEIVTDAEDIGFCYWNISDNYALLKDGHSLYGNHNEFYEYIHGKEAKELYFDACNSGLPKNQYVETRLENI